MTRDYDVVAIGGGWPSGPIAAQLGLVDPTAARLAQEHGAVSVAD